MAETNLTECRLGVGATTLSLLCPSVEYAASMREYFRPGVVEREPDLTLRLEVVPHEDRPRVPDSLFATKTVDGDRFAMDGDLVTGRFDPLTRQGELRVKRILTKELMTRVFEQLLYQAFYSARRIRDYPAVLMHACGVMCDGAGYLFVGEPGAGKSTVAALSGEFEVLNDEICLVEFGTAGAMLHGTPFNGHFAGKVAGQAPLRAVFLLSHGPDHRLEPVPLGAGVSLLTGQVVAPLPLEEPLTRQTSERMLDLAGRLATAAPLRRLLFTPDAGFWPVIRREFPPKERPA